jgi:hypothetical protein
MTHPQLNVTIQIECTDLPSIENLWVGIQEGKSVVQQTKLPAETVTFTAELRIRNTESDPAPNFLGPFAQGTKDDRFIYICWGSPAHGGWHGVRRAKLPLGTLTWRAIKSGTIKAKLRCTDAKGGPICATVKPSHLEWLSD